MFKMSTFGVDTG